MLELKTYQRDTLDAFSHWVEVLKEAAEGFRNYNLRQLKTSRS